MRLWRGLRGPKQPPLALAEGALALLEVALGFGLGSAAAVAAVLGQFLLAAVLALVLFGVALRLLRRRRRRPGQGASPPRR